MGRRQFPDPVPLMALADPYDGLKRPQGVTTATGKAEDSAAVDAHNRSLQVARVGNAVRDYADAHRQAAEAWQLTQGGSERQNAAYAKQEADIRKLVAQGIPSERIFERLGEPRWMSNAYATRIAEIADEKAATALAILQGVLLEFEPVIEDWCQANPDYGKAVRSAVDSILGLEVAAA